MGEALPGALKSHRIIDPAMYIDGNLQNLDRFGMENNYVRIEIKKFQTFLVYDSEILSAREQKKK